MMNCITRIRLGTAVRCSGSRPLIVASYLGRRFYTSPPAIGPIRPPALSELRTEQEHKEAEDWVLDFKTKYSASTRIPRNLVDLSFSRSSGPGGQNVNKVNTKVTLRCSMNSPWLPRWSLPYLKNTPFYVPSSHSLLLTSTVHRSQAHNIDECFDKLRDLIITAASSSIQKATTPEQKKKVEMLARIENERRKKDKMHKSEVKRGRRDQGYDF